MHDASIRRSIGACLGAFAFVFRFVFVRAASRCRISPLRCEVLKVCRHCTLERSSAAQFDYLAVLGPFLITREKRLFEEHACFWLHAALHRYHFNVRMGPGMKVHRRFQKKYTLAHCLVHATQTRLKALNLHLGLFIALQDRAHVADRHNLQMSLDEHVRIHFQPQMVFSPVEMTHERLNILLSVQRRHDSTARRSCCWDFMALLASRCNAAAWLCSLRWNILMSISPSSSIPALSPLPKAPLPPSSVPW
mmetsp:Transcript_12606/g.22027  ORF Transcript_12606/g.22027 Transcript_12606/m.22027 type:complete len:250 (-) Transcript_12606:73-822(-)